jgi:hypothetical protein
MIFRQIEEYFIIYCLPPQMAFFRIKISINRFEAKLFSEQKNLPRKGFKIYFVRLGAQFLQDKSIWSPNL